MGDGITYMFTKTNLKVMFLFTSGREILVVGCVITRLIKCVHHENINVRCDTIKFTERDLPFQRFTRDVIEKVTHIAHAKQPAVCRCSSPVEDGVGSCFDDPIVPYRRVLVRELDLAMCVSPSSNGSKMRSLWTNQMKS